MRIKQSMNHTRTFECPRTGESFSGSGVVKDDTGVGKVVFVATVPCPECGEEGHTTSIEADNIGVEL